MWTELVLLPQQWCALFLVIFFAFHLLFLVVISQVVYPHQSFMTGDQFLDLNLNYLS